MFKEIQETLSRIETQTIKTNGRVSKLELEEIPNLKGFNQRIIGALIIITVIVIPLVSFIFNEIT